MLQCHEHAANFLNPLTRTESLLLQRRGRSGPAASEAGAHETHYRTPSLTSVCEANGSRGGHLRILLMSIAEHLRKHPLAACTLPRGPLSIHGRSISIWICHKFSSLAILSALLQDRCFSDGENIWGKLAISHVPAHAGSRDQHRLCNIIKIPPPHM